LEQILDNVRVSDENAVGVRVDIVENYIVLGGGIIQQQQCQRKKLLML
jgi:hypothetical protein